MTWYGYWKHLRSKDKVSTFAPIRYPHKLVITDPCIAQYRREAKGSKSYRWKQLQNVCAPRQSPVRQIEQVLVAVVLGPKTICPTVDNGSDNVGSTRGMNPAGPLCFRGWKCEARLDRCLQSTLGTWFSGNCSPNSIPHRQTTCGIRQGISWWNRVRPNSYYAMTLNSL